MVMLSFDAHVHILVCTLKLCKYFVKKCPGVDNHNLTLSSFPVPIHTFHMNITGHFKAASVPPCRYGDKFKNPKFHPRIRNNRSFVGERS